MPAIEIQQNSPKISEDSTKKFWLSFGFLFLAVILFHGKIVPHSNEFVYLLRLDPHFLVNDWTFSTAAEEHWFFNFLFGFAAPIFSLETIGWTGRIGVWALCLAALLKLGRHWAIPIWAVGVSIFLWLAFAQSVVNDEWIFGGFEAKAVAYVCLLIALVKFSEQKIIAPSILLGLSFSFHPAVGLWAIPAIGLALLFEKIPAIDFLKVVGVTFLFSLFGLLPLLAEQNAGYSFDDWQFIILYRVPWHLDLFQFSKSGMFLIFLMLAFNVFALRKSESFALRFLLKFQIWLGVFFAFGFLLRWLEIYSVLRLMPMRLFPIFTPLFFIFTVIHFVSRLESTRYKLVVALFAVFVVAALEPFDKGFGQVRQTVQSWTNAPDDFQKNARWIAENTPIDALVIEPPNRRDWWYFSHRASVVSFAYPTYDRLSEWRTRVADLTGNRQISKGETASDEIETAFNQLSEPQIEQLKTKYGATHLVSRAVYSYPIIFETETYKVYRLQ